MDASKAKCFKCNQKGHFWRDCKEGREDKSEKPKKSKKKKPKKGEKQRSRRSQTPAPNGEGSGTETEGEDSSPENVEARRTVTTASAKRVVTATCRQGVEMSSSPTPPIDLEVMAKASQRSPKKLRNSIPDTGCTSTVIKSAEAAKLKLKIDKNMEINLTDATGKQMRTDGIATMFVKTVHGATRRIKAIVSPDLADSCLISWSDLITLEYLPQGWPHSHKVRKTSAGNTVRMTSAGATVMDGEEDEPEEKKPWPPPEWGQEVVDVVKEFIHLFKNKLEKDSIIKCPPMDIEFKEGAEIPKTSHCRNIPYHLQGMADDFLKDAIHAGSIEGAVDAEAEAPAHFVEKLDSEGNIIGVRLVCDLTLNPRDSSSWTSQVDITRSPCPRRPESTSTSSYLKAGSGIPAHPWGSSPRETGSTAPQTGSSLGSLESRRRWMISLVMQKPMLS